MKNLIKVSLLFFVLVIVAGCEKSQDTTTSTGNAMMGKKYTDIEATIYQITPNNVGNCEGWYLQCNHLEFEFLIKIESGLPESITSLPNLEQRNFTIDLEFNGSNFYCSKPYSNKRLNGNPGGIYPYEVQEVSLIEIIPSN